MSGDGARYRSVPGRPTNLVIVGHRPTGLAVGVGWGYEDIFLSFLCLFSLEKRRMADSMDSVLIISLPEEDNLQLYQNYRNIRLLSHQSKVIMKVILNRLNAQPEEIIARFRAGRSVTKYLQV